MLTLLRELIQSLRSLTRDRAFTFFSVLALALGLGLNGALLVLSRTFLLRPAPVMEPGTLLEVMDLSNHASKPEGGESGSTSAYDALRHLPAFAETALASVPRTKTWNGRDRLEPVQVMQITHEYLPLLGIQPYLGRDFLPNETGAGSTEKVAILSHHFWKANLDSRRDVLGTLVKVDGKEYSVVGILPPGFEGHSLSENAELFLPCQDQIVPPTMPFRSMGTVLARLRPGTSLAQAKAALRSLDWGKDFHLELHAYHPLPGNIHRKLSRGLAGLHGAALLILAIGLANVLSLQTARLQRRRHELALRTALGARPGQLFRMILLENLLLSLLAGGAAILLAILSAPMLEAIQALLPYPPKMHVTFGLWTGLATLLLAMLLGALLACFVYLQARRMDLGSPLKEGRTLTGGWRLRGLLVATQAALALVLLCSASLCLKDLRRQLDIPLGLEIRDRYLLECEPGKVGRKDAELLPTLPVLQERLRQIPGVQAIAMNQGRPIKGFSAAIAGQMGGPHTFLLAANYNLPSLLGMKLQEGRFLEAGDEDQPRVLVSAEYAQQRWPGESALGKTFQFVFKNVEVAGVLKSTRFEGPTDQPEPYVFAATSRLDPFQAPLINFTIHAQGSPSAVKAAIRNAARAELRDIPFTLNSLEELRSEKLSQPRQLFFLSAIMGAVALFLSLCGLYGISAHLAESRQRELGIRVAMGAGPGTVLTLLAKGSLLPLVPGLGMGSLLAMVTSRVLVHQSDGFAPLDMPVLLYACLLLSTAAALATLFPALRAARMSPARALRSE